MTGSLVFDLLPMKMTGISMSRPYGTSGYVSIDEHAEEAKWWDGMAVSRTTSLTRWAEAMMDKSSSLSVLLIALLTFAVHLNRHVQRNHQGNAMLCRTSARARCIPFEWMRLKLKVRDLKLRSIPLRCFPSPPAQFRRPLWI